MPTFSFYINGDILVEADDFETAHDSVRLALSEMFSDFTIDAAYGNEGEFIL